MGLKDVYAMNHSDMSAHSLHTHIHKHMHKHRPNTAHRYAYTHAQSTNHWHFYHKISRVHTHTNKTQ